jgi:hypothetical protein
MWYDIHLTISEDSPSAEDAATAFLEYLANTRSIEVRVVEVKTGETEYIEIAL